MRLRDWTSLAVGTLGAGAAGAAAALGDSSLALVAAVAALAAGVIGTLVVADARQAAERAAQAAQDAQGLAEAANARAEAARRAATDHSLVQVFDRDTGLLDNRVFVVSLERKMAAARRHLRPLCVVLVDVSAGLDPGLEERRAGMARFAEVLRSTLRDADIACRIGGTTFGLLLEDTSERGGVECAERIKAAMSRTSGAPQHLVAAVAAYPTHGFGADQVLDRARDALESASSTQTSGSSRVVLA